MTKEIYDMVFVHAAEMYWRNKNNFGFLSEDKDGFLWGEIRVEAIQIMRRLDTVKEIIIVGGPIREGEGKGISKPKLIAEMIGGEVTELLSQASTRGNFVAIKDWLKSKEIEAGNKEIGFLTNYYHLPRVERMIKKEGLRNYLIHPISAEEIILIENPKRIEEIVEMYRRPSGIERLRAEMKGLSALRQSDEYSGYEK